jgi:glycosyltransferase involved in cell wall biosynthesis
VVAQFRDFVRDGLPRARYLLTTSKATAADVERWTAREGIALRARPTPIPIGTTFDSVPGQTLPSGLPPSGYVLMVGTLEPRKNHRLAFRVWQRLLEELPREQVPTLVFAGRIGWMFDDQLQAIASSNRLDGKLVLAKAPDDATLAALYRNCRFTLFPSHYEGWGLPVSESLAWGKVCIASNSSALPEAGGDLCLYIDPDNIAGAHAVIRSAIEEPGRIESMAARIAAAHRPRPWSEMADEILTRLDLDAASA